MHPPTHLYYDAPLPAHLEAELAGLYQSAFCVKEFFELFKGIADYKALVILDGGNNPKHILCYIVKNNCLQVLNELFEIAPAYLDYASRAFFEKYPQIDKVNFTRIKSDLDAVASPYRLWSRSNDIVAQLPSSIEAYDARLGKSTKKTVKYHLNRLQRENQDFRFDTASCDAIAPSIITRIIDMNRSRMESKHIRSGYDPARERNVIEFCKRYGTVTTITIKDQVVAGLICYDMGSHVFGETLAHDEAYNKSRIGQVCFYLTLKHFIEKGKSHYHMMEGDYDYKYSYLGESQDLFSLSSYRSSRHKTMDLPYFLAHQTDTMLKQLRYYCTVIKVAAINRKFPVRRKA